MMKSILPKFRRLCLAALLLWILYSCASMRTTAPNHTYQGPYPDVYNKLKMHNPLLAAELGKLPELKDGRYLLVVNYGPNGNRISGPYQNIDQVDEALGYGKYFDKKSPFQLGLY